VLGGVIGLAGAVGGAAMGNPALFAAPAAGK
jgi:hypothetical protein